MHSLVRSVVLLVALGTGAGLGYVIGAITLLLAASNGLISLKRMPEDTPLPLDPWAGAIVWTCVVVTSVALALLCVKRLNLRGLPVQDS